MSKVRILFEGEKFAVTQGETKFFYKRASSDQISLLRKKYTDSQFKFDDIGFGNEIFETFIVGWEGLIDGKGNELPFDKSIIKFLPSPTKTLVVSAINGERLDDELVGAKLEKKS